jgi:hypothetical protein
MPVILRADQRRDCQSGQRLTSGAAGGRSPEAVPAMEEPTALGGTMLAPLLDGTAHC